MAHYEPPHQYLYYLQLQLFSSLVLKELSQMSPNSRVSKIDLICTAQFAPLSVTVIFPLFLIIKYIWKRVSIHILFISLSQYRIIFIFLITETNNYRKNSKNWDTLNYHRDCPTNGIVGFYSAILRSKDADRITNRVDTDQTAPRGAV